MLNVKESSWCWQVFILIFVNIVNLNLIGKHSMYKLIVISMLGLGNGCFLLAFQTHSIFELEATVKHWPFSLSQPKDEYYALT